MARNNARTSNQPFSASSSSAAATKTNKKDRSKRASKLDPATAYTYLPSLPKRHRTSTQTLSLSREEAGPSESKWRRPAEDEDEDDDMDARIRKLAMMIADDGTGVVESDDDDDVDSDEAWEEEGSDEERWGDVFRQLDKGKGKKGKAKAPEVVRKPAKPLTVNLDDSDDDDFANKGARATTSKSGDEDEDDEESDGDEEVDEHEEMGEDSLDGEIEVEGASMAKSQDHDGEESDEDDDNDDDELELPSDLSEDDEPETLDGLDAFVDKLATDDKKRKAETEPVAKPKKRRVLPSMAAPALSTGNDLGLKSSQKVDLTSLISSHPSLSSSSAKALLPPKNTTTSTLKQGVLPAPLPTVVQDRLNREAAYEKTREEGQKWSTLMKRVKEAEHLSFPLQGSDRGGVKSGGEILANFQPSNAHESAVQALLAKANLTESGVKATEDEALRGQDLTLEEVAERRQQLRHQRELMFREEAKAKRVSKIKSKTFRKLARKRAERKGGEVDLENMNEEDADELREKMERQRAKERATLKHGAKTSRWARENGGGEDEDRRRAKEEMLEIKERLNRRIAGKGDESSEEESDSGDEGDETAIRAKAFDQLTGDDGKQEEEGGKGLMQMAFMQKAQERRKKQVKELEAEAKRDIELFGNEDDEGDEGDSGEEEIAASMQIGGTGGRMVFSGPVPTSNGNQSLPQVQHNQGNVSAPATLHRSPSPPSLPDANPWLVASASAGPSRKRNDAVNANSSSTDKALAGLKKAKDSAKTSQKLDDESVEIETDGNKLLRKHNKANGVGGGGDSGDEDELLPRTVGGRVGFKQRDLVGEAFAGDNVVEEFENEKQRIIEEDAPKVEDTSLPGWGAWGGKGSKKRSVNPAFLKKTAGIEAAERKDAKLSNVIITEKKDRKATAFQVKDLPYPYTSVAQYEARFSNPIGAEWNARGVHQKETLPRVTKKKGAIIEPVRRLF